MLADKMVFMADLREKHQQELENLTLTTQPFKTIKLFILGVIQYLKRSVLYLLAKGGWLMLSCTVVAALGILLVTIDGPHEKVMLVNVNSSLTFHLEELSEYFRFGLWWVALGVASSIGLGENFNAAAIYVSGRVLLMFSSGLHTFVLYLGPHIALFTIKAMQCGRVDLKSAPYDTIQLKRGPSWLDKDCDEFGPPLFSSSEGSRVPLSSILPQVQLEAILWGVGTALGELPPYFISRAASISGSRLDAMDEFDDSSTESDGVVPNPLFDLAGIMCGQFGVPFWKFFLATLIGKAIIKTHIQTVFIISVCNNQLLDWIENELIWVLSLVPGFAPVLPSLVAKLHTMRAKYLKPQQPSSHIKVKKWDFSFASVWNTIVWLMLMNFFVKIVTDTAQRYLKKQQDKEIAALTNNSSASRQSSIEVQSDGFTSFSHHRSPENRILQQVLIQKLV
ncbi:vacuole membrane protein KMS1 [Citrus sinensis]|uniref:Vacuole membrane protein KMS1 n=1 Tax=Citrus sinensis TaxID=2711 RepID=A0ACB8I6Q0_CITSI|nr:vacuole membrane protein KMS1 [Citrus sinensis]